MFREEESRIQDYKDRVKRRDRGECKEKELKRRKGRGLIRVRKRMRQGVKSRGIEREERKQKQGLQEVQKSGRKGQS